MSYNGTVTCSHCYQSGHNKRACPSLTAEIKRRYEYQMKEIEAYRTMSDAEIERTNTDRQWNIDYHTNKANRARELYLKRTKIDLATGEKVSNKVAKAERMKNVTCGYCKERGHTRRTCTHVKRDKQVFIEETRRMRIAALESARDLGIGVGSILPIRSTGYDKDGEWRSDLLTLRYIKSVAWDDCHANSTKLTVTHVDARKLAAPDQHRYTSRDQFERLVQANDKALRYADAEGQDLPVSSLIPTLDPPKGWLQPSEQSLTEAIKRAFPTTGNEYNKSRKYDYSYPSGITINVIKDLGLQEHYDVS